MVEEFKVQSYFLIMKLFLSWIDGSQKVFFNIWSKSWSLVTRESAKVTIGASQLNLMFDLLL